MNKITQDNQNGFTLIEIMIAMLILAIGILGVVRMQLTAVKGNSYATGLTEATTFAQNKMEKLAVLAYNDLDLNDNDGSGTNQDADANGIDDDDEGTFVDGINNFGLDDISTPDGFQQDSGATNILYNILWNIAVDKPAANAKHIRLYVQWQQKGVTRTVIFDRIKANI